MAKNKAITLRVSESLKKRLEARARRARRSLSAQVVSDLEAVVEAQGAGTGGGRFLGLYRGAKLPTDDDILEVRTLLWGRLGRE
ncbi:MAG: hypothetical protein JXR96_07765 [Deltaproteobacteria bacterium]|nr:hypothetical protein [Deltaproteobacteria bacterium]